jgi:hypothetical protein
MGQPVCEHKAKDPPSSLGLADQEPLRRNNELGQIRRQRLAGDVVMVVLAGTLVQDMFRPL